MATLNAFYSKYNAPLSIGMRPDEETLLKQSEALPKPTFKGLLFHLPFALTVPTGFLCEETENPMETRVQVYGHQNHGFEVVLDAAEYGKRVTGSSLVVKLLFSHRNNPLPIAMRVHGVATFAGDVTGKLSNTIVWAEIPLESINKAFYWDNGLYCDIAIDAVNRFIEHYKSANLNRAPDKFISYIPRITAQAVMKFRVITNLETQEHYIEDYIDMNGFSIGDMPEEIAIELKNTLLTNAEIPVLDAFRLQIEHGITSKNWRAVAIESAVLFEAWLTPMLKEEYVKKELKSKEIKLKFKTGEEHLPMSLGVIISTLIEDATGFAFQDTAECAALLTNTITLRNHIVHGRKFSVSAKQALLSYKSVQDAVEIIESHCA